jgi:hypothetical protein
MGAAAEGGGIRNPFPHGPFEFFGIFPQDRVPPGTEIV